MLMGELAAAIVAFGAAAAALAAALRQCCLATTAADIIEFELVPMSSFDPPPHPQAQPSQFNPNDLTIHRVLGSGGFSIVYQATLNGNLVALKCQDAQPHAARERDLVQDLAPHPHLPHCLGSCDWTSSDGAHEIWTVFEFVRGGDLTRALPSLSWSQRTQIALDIATALSFLHQNDIIHRDVKCANILLDDDFRARLCDFGFARRIDEDEEGASDHDRSSAPRRKRRMTLCGTEAYMAPEIFFDEPLDERVDVFSFGVVLIELISRQMVHHNSYLVRTPASHFAIDVDEFRRHVPRSCPRSLVCLAEMCISVESDLRPTALEIVEWLQDLKAELDDVSSDGDTVCVDDDDRSMSFTGSPTNDLVVSSFEGTLLIKRSMSHPAEWVSTHVQVCNHRLTLTSEASTPATAVALADCAIDDSSEDALQGRHTLHPTLFRMSVLLSSGEAEEWDCQAPSALEAQLWRAKLHHAIDTSQVVEAQQVGGSVSSIVQEDEMYNWLSNLGLSHYYTTFKAKGFTTLEFLRESGLEDEDFMYLGIDDYDDQEMLVRAITDLRDYESFPL